MGFVLRDIIMSEPFSLIGESWEANPAQTDRAKLNGSLKSLTSSESATFQSL